jgi:type I restriction enzyme S subunit
VRIEDVAETVTRGKQPTYVDEDGIPVLNQSCIYWDGFNEEEVRQLDPDVADEWKDKYFVKNGDVLINSTGKGTLGRAIYWSKESDHFALDSHITRVSIDESKLSPEYLRYYLESTWGQTMLYIFCVSGSTGQIELSKTDLLTMPVIVPSLSEQRRIASILSSVDEQIQQTEAIIDAVKEQKRGLMQDLFRPPVSNGISTKLGKVPDTWEVGQIRDFGVSFISGGTPSRDHPEYFGGETPWLKTSEVQNCRVRSSEEFISEAGLEESSADIVSSGSVLVAMYGGGTVGNVGLLEIEATTNQACCAIDTEGTILNNEFLYYQLLFEHRRLVSYAAGSSQQNLSKNDVKQFDIVVPPEKEQRQIAKIMGEVDDKLEQEQQNKKHLKELKRGLMQDLLTGKVRVNTDN